MKLLLIFITFFIVFISKANHTVTINNKQYTIYSNDPERPYIVWLSDTSYFEDYDYNKVIEYLYSINNINKYETIDTKQSIMMNKN